jgi:hypothetical protein
MLGLLPEYRRRKLGSVAARLLLRMCFTELGARRRRAGGVGALAASAWAGAEATEQFEVSDERSAEELSRALRGRGLDPVWKDWDRALAG